MEVIQSLIENIISLEWEMFSHVKGVTPAPCQRAPDHFRKIRGSNYEIWSKEMLESYLNDLEAARIKGRNLVKEKYARMDNLIPPLTTNTLIDEIVGIETEWQDEIRKKFPAIYNHMCRDVNDATDGSNFSIYLKCEIETYGSKTIDLYYNHVKTAFENHKNLAISALERLVKKGGFNDLDHAEKFLKNQFV